MRRAETLREREERGRVAKEAQRAKARDERRAMARLQRQEGRWRQKQALRAGDATTTEPGPSSDSDDIDFCFANLTVSRTGIKVVDFQEPRPGDCVDQEGKENASEQGSALEGAREKRVKRKLNFDEVYGDKNSKKRRGIDKLTPESPGMSSISAPTGTPTSGRRPREGSPPPIHVEAWNSDLKCVAWVGGHEQHFDPEDNREHLEEDYYGNVDVGAPDSPVSDGSSDYSDTANSDVDDGWSNISNVSSLSDPSYRDLI